MILADGFYEWQGNKGEKQPMFITTQEGAPFAFAGLWESWRGKGSEADAYRSCAIITRAAKGAISSLHHRMPVIMHPDGFGEWLDPENSDPVALSAILESKAVTDLVFHPVAKRVNSVRNNDPSNIRPGQGDCLSVQIDVVLWGTSVAW